MLKYNDLINDKNKYPRDLDTKQLPIEEYNSTTKTLSILFGTKIIAKDFSFYWGSILFDIDLDSVDNIEIDWHKTNYANLFCISKIILALIDRKKKVSIIWPENSVNNKMLRYMYNRGILDLLFQNTKNNVVNIFTQQHEKIDFIINYINDKIITDYTTVYNFDNCFDQAIHNYSVLCFKDVPQNDIKREEGIDRIVKKVLLNTENYFSNKRNSNIYNNIKDRMDLYLYEIISNVIEHAYTNGAGVFSVLVTNDYLPEYAKSTKNKFGQDKFNNREKRLEKEIPEKFSGNIISTFLGGLTIFVDDIGCGIGSSKISRGHYSQLYKEVFLFGINKEKRSRHSTSMNGLKLIADQISNYNDKFWCHDNQNWIGTSFLESRLLAKLDLSESQIRNHQYKAPYANGVTYEIGINYSRGSKEKETSYNTYGAPVDYDINDLKSILGRNADNDFCTYIDRLNIFSPNISKGNKERKTKNLIVRLSEKRKDQLYKELKISILDKLKPVYENLFIYDLDAIALFQLKAVFETPHLVSKIKPHIINEIVLLGIDGFIFAFKYDLQKESYILNKSNSLYFINNNKELLLNVFSVIYKNNNNLINKYIFDPRTSKVRTPIVYTGKIQWGSQTIHSYIDVEAMLNSHMISIMILFLLKRTNGMLRNYKFQFLEEFMETRFDSHLNEFANKQPERIFIGSVILSKKTETYRVNKDDVKIYLFKHNESKLDFDDSYIFLLKYPDITFKKNIKNYRRVSSTNKIEEYSVNSEELSFYKSNEYKRLISTLDYNIGFSNQGIIKPIINEKFKENFEVFTEYIIKQMLKKYNTIGVTLNSNMINLFDGEDEFNKFKEKFKIQVNKLVNKRSKNKKVIINGNLDTCKTRVNISYTYSFVDFLEYMRNDSCNICISVFNIIEFDSGFDKIIDHGYYPFIPIMYNNGISKTDVNRFLVFSKSLIKQYKLLLEKYIDDNYNFINKDFFDDIYRYFNTSSYENNLFYDSIMFNVYTSLNQEYIFPFNNPLYILLVRIISNGISSFIYSANADSKKVNTFFADLVSLCNNGIEDNIVLFFIFVLLYCLNVLPILDIQEIENLKILNAFEDNNISNIYKILCAWILKSIDQVKFSKILQRFFINNDVTMYFHKLYSQLFNKHGSDHDGPITSYIKTNYINDENSENLINVLEECLEYLKLPNLTMKVLMRLKKHTIFF